MTGADAVECGATPARKSSRFKSGIRDDIRGRAGWSGNEHGGRGHPDGGAACSCDDGSTSTHDELRSARAFTRRASGQADRTRPRRRPSVGTRPGRQSNDNGDEIGLDQSLSRVELGRLGIEARVSARVRGSVTRGRPRWSVARASCAQVWLTFPLFPGVMRCVLPTDDQSMALVWLTMMPDSRSRVRQQLD